MRQKSGPAGVASEAKPPAEKTLKDIRRATRRHFSAEEKIRVVMEGLRGEESIAKLCQCEGEAGKRRLTGDTARSATTEEVKALKREAQALKEAVADLALVNRLLKKSAIADGDADREAGWIASMPAARRLWLISPRGQPSEGALPHHQPGLYRHQGRQ